MSETNAKIQHKWAAGGVSSYPLTHPIVGQRQFFETFRHFIHLVDEEAEAFAHVFAVIAQWGVGKSRLGYELIAQVNESSKGWYLRNRDGSLGEAQLFNDDDDRDQYLALYIRYSQIANDYHNVDNWFAFGLYKSLVLIAQEQFDNSIQGQIAKEAYDRLLVKGFDHIELADVLEVSADHSDEDLYTDPTLASRLCQAAYDYLKQFGISYILVVLDELETAAEAATYGLESDQLKKLDGRAIKLMGKAIKEEDPRRKMPWLRYVALCSPAIGDELREIQSTARRFEMAELAANSFSDVSTFVQILADDGRLPNYETGLVEAAYTMSAGNFGWYNVVMANVDSMLEQRRIRGEDAPKTLGDLFQDLVGVSSRIREYVLDHNAIDVLKLENRDQLRSARELLYGQLPVPLDRYNEEQRKTLLNGRNEFDEPIALLFRRVEWDDLEATRALFDSKFNRDKEFWRLGGVDQPLDLKQLLSNLGTYAIHETQGAVRSDGKHTLLIPLRQSDFIQLIGLLYPHPAAEDAARALWRKFLGNRDISQEDATHIAPSMAMMARLDLRHRQQGQKTLVFRDPDMGEAHSDAIAARKGERHSSRARSVLVGAMRVLDQNWEYDAVSSGMGDDEVVSIATAQKTKQRPAGGLVTLEGLKLHPKGRLVLAWVKNIGELERICRLASEQFTKMGRFPVVVFTSSRALVDQYNAPTTDIMKNASSYLMLYQLSSTEEHALYQVGLSSSSWRKFVFNDSVFTSSFSNRLQGIIRPFMQAVVDWRRRLDRMGRIAWPMRASGNLREPELETLIHGWCHLRLVKDEPLSLADLDESAPVDVEALVAVLAKLRITPKARAAGYGEDERAFLFSGFDDSARVIFPFFLSSLIKRLVVDNLSWTFDVAKREWFWGYAWEGAKERTIYQEWMNLLCEMRFAEESKTSGKGPNEYGLRTRSSLSNMALEASNWLNGEYGQIVGKMAVVFGEGRVQDLFGPEGSQKVGAKTKKARQFLNDAQDSLSALEIKEASSLFEKSAEDLVKELCACARHRREMIRKVDFVFNRDRYQQTKHDENIRTLNLDDDGQALWRRIRRAELFIEYVRKAEKRIRKRVEDLQQEIRESVSETFPVELFTLSLEKIAHILDGALNPKPGDGQTEAAQVIGTGTLHYYLRDLQIGEASAVLDKLADELGLDPRTGQTTHWGEIEGGIIQAFRTLRKTHDDIRSSLASHNAKLTEIDTQLAGAPKDFIYPDTLPALDILKAKPELIGEELEETRTEEVDRLRKAHDGPARLGNFQPLMEKAVRLFDPPKNNTQDLAGQIQTVENTIAGYRRKLLENPKLRDAFSAINALKRAKNKKQIVEVTLATLEKQDSLRQCVQFIQECLATWNKDGNALLNDTKVSFDRWALVVGAIESGLEFELEAKEADLLVNHGFLRRTYSLMEGSL
jgi:hypothetical protein